MQLPWVLEFCSRRFCWPILLLGSMVVCNLGRPNPPLKSDPARIAFHALSAFRYLGSAQSLGTGGAA